MGLAIFGLILALLIHTFLENSQTLQASFYVESLILFVFSIYFILYLVYNGFNVKITDDVRKTFTREYLFSYIKEKLKKEKDYTLILISVDNLDDIEVKLTGAISDTNHSHELDYLQGKHLSTLKPIYESEVR